MSALSKFVGCILFASFLFMCPNAKANKFFALGTASNKGTYYPVGKAFCKQINRSRDEHKLRCLEYTTGGSVYNIQALSSGELDLAITRSDLAYFAYRGEERFLDMGPNNELRTLLNLYTQPLLITVKKSSGIKTFSDFAGRKINIGNKGSGKRDIAEKIFRIMGWSKKYFSSVTEFSTKNQEVPFCSGQVDILIESIGLPNKLYERLSKQCDAIFISVPAKILSGLKELGPFFFDYTVPAKFNPGSKNIARTLGIKVVLLTQKKIHINSISTITRLIINDLEGFKSAHPALADVSIKHMFKEGIRVPLHDGVVSELQKSKKRRQKK